MQKRFNTTGLKNNASRKRQASLDCMVLAERCFLKSFLINGTGGMADDTWCDPAFAMLGAFCPTADGGGTLSARDYLR